MLHGLASSLSAHLSALLAPAVAERLTLLFNHVLGAEPTATTKLAAHAGKALRVQLAGWPALLPPPPPLAWRVTPAGLLEWCGQDAALVPELQLEIDASNPALLAAQAFSGQTPPVRIDGDAAFAGDVNWLIQNLRWDVAADLERFFGPVVAQQLHQLGTWFSAGLRQAVKAASALGERLRPGR